MYKSDNAAPNVSPIDAGGRLDGGAARSGAPDASGKRGFLLAAAAIVGLAALLRLLFIAKYEVWLDEAYVFIVARQGLGGIIAALHVDNGPPLYYLLLHYWMAVFGSGALAMRSMSALFSVAAVAAVLAWSAPWFPRRARLAAGFLFAITPLAVYYAQEARMYSPVMFFVIVSMIFLERGLRAGGARNWAIFALFTALAFYTSYVAVFVAPLGYVVVAVEYLKAYDAETATRRLKGLIAAHFAAAVLFAPWLPIAARQPSAEATRWLMPGWHDANKAMLPLESLSVMTTGGAWYHFRLLASGPERIEALRKQLEPPKESGTGAQSPAAAPQAPEAQQAVLEEQPQVFLSGPIPRLMAAVPAVVPLVLMGALSLAMLAYALARRGGNGFPWRLFLLAWIALALGAPFLSSFIRPMYFVGRYEITALPAFVILTGIGLAAMPRWLRPACLALGSVLFLYTWGLMEYFPITGRYEAKAKTLAATAHKGDVVLALAFEYAPYYYYLGPDRDEVTWMTFPRETLSHAAWIDYDKWLFPAPFWDTPRPGLEVEADNALYNAIDKAGPGGRIIVVRATEAHRMFDAMNEVFGRALVAIAGSGRIDYDKAASHAEMGIMVFVVRR